MPAVNFMPNIDTAEKAERLKELLDAKDRAETTLIRVIQQNRDEILRAVQYALQKDVLIDEPEYEVEDDNHPDGFREVNIHGHLKAVLDDYAAAQDKVIGFAASGQE